MGVPFSSRCAAILPRPLQLSVRNMGGPLPDYEFTDYGLEIYRELYGSTAVPSVDFVVPVDDAWPAQLHGRPLGQDVRRWSLLTD